MIITKTNWKKEPLVWMIILIPFSAIIMGVVMITLALKSETGLVVDDYYKKGKEINQVLARDEMARTLGLQAQLTLNETNHRLSITIKTNPNTTLANELTLRLLHATRPDVDQTILLHGITTYFYQGTFDPLSLGRWNVQLETSTWRLLGSLQRPGALRIQLSPGLD